MPIDINGTTSVRAGSNFLAFDSIIIDGNGYVHETRDGYSGFKDIPGDDTFYTPGTNYAWPVNSVFWNSGLNGTTGVFTCPTAGFYACGFNGIMDGFGSNNSYGYAAFAKNYVTYGFFHWNLADGNAWDQTGCHTAFHCEAGDTLTFHINGSPVPYVMANATAGNYGAYPHNHHHIWIARIG